MQKTWLITGQRRIQEMCPKNKKQWLSSYEISKTLPIISKTFNRLFPNEFDGYHLGHAISRRIPCAVVVVALYFGDPTISSHCSTCSFVSALNLVVNGYRTTVEYAPRNYVCAIRGQAGKLSASTRTHTHTRARARRRREHLDGECRTI